jgi:hypothetical protein
MSDKRSPHTDALETLGTIIDERAARDAIHLAVIPCVAKVALEPGEDVGPDGTRENPQGIVDPFLKKPVRVGETFWLVVYPRKVTSLRHVWSHPEFPDDESPKPSAVSYSEQWLRFYAHRVSPYYSSPDEAYKKLLEGLRNKEIFYYGSDLHGRYELEDEEELRHHGEVVLGRSLNFGEFLFSCSC